MVRQEAKRLIADLDSSIRQIDNFASQMKNSSDTENSSLSKAKNRLNNLMNKASGEILPKLQKEHKEYISNARDLDNSARKLDNNSGKHMITQASKELKKQAKKHKQIIRDLEKVLNRAKSSLAKLSKVVESNSAKSEISSAINAVKKSGPALESRVSGVSGGYYDFSQPQYGLPRTHEQFLRWITNSHLPPTEYEEMMAAEYYYQNSPNSPLNNSLFGSSPFSYSPTSYKSTGYGLGPGFFY